MEEIKKIEIIDLAEYGEQGEIILRKPSPRRQNMLKNQLSRYYSDITTRTLKPDVPLGDMETLMMLQYISEAPFEPTLEGYFSYTDGMDADYAIALNEEIEKRVQEIMSYSPFARSLPQETKTSE